MDQETYEAIEESIEHHKENLKILEEGKKNKRKFTKGTQNFLIGEEQGEYQRVSFSGSACALCVTFSNESGCRNCPLILDNDWCDNADSTWNKINNARTIIQAIRAEKAMIKKLESLRE